MLLAAAGAVGVAAAANATTTTPLASLFHAWFRHTATTTSNSNSVGTRALWIEDDVNATTTTHTHGPLTVAAGSSSMGTALTTHHTLDAHRMRGAGSAVVVRHVLLHALHTPTVDRVVLVSFQRPAAHVHASLANFTHATLALSKLHVIDAFTYPSLNSSASSSSSSSSSSSLAHLSATIEAALLHRTPDSAPHATTAAPPTTLLILDGISPLLLHHGAPQVAAWLRDLSTRSTRVRNDGDAHAAAAAALVLHADAPCAVLWTASQRALVASLFPSHVQCVRAELTPITPLRLDVRVTHTRSSFRTSSTSDTWEEIVAPSEDARTSTTVAAHLIGTLRSVRAVDDAEGGGADSSASSVDRIDRALNALGVNEKAAATSSSSSSSSSAMTHDTTFNLSLTEKQRAARAQVVLPYQHTGGASASATMAPATSALNVSLSDRGFHVARREDGADDDDEFLDDADQDDPDDDLDI